MKELPLFPLNLVPFPGEPINLHVFEPRYKQLVNDCLKGDRLFGIPSYINNKIDLGTEVEILEITKKYDDGRMDIKTKALKAFQVEQFWNPWGEKLYAGGRVDYLKLTDASRDLSLLIKFKELCSQLFGWLGDLDVPDISTVNSVYDIGHKIGFKIEEEYQLLSITDENERLRFAIDHLERLMPALERAQSAQEKIKQNGHFKHLDPLKF